MKTKTTAETSATNYLETNTSEQLKTSFNIKFYVMKKQILFLMVALMATFTALGQALPGSAPRGTACIDDYLHPIAGKEYTYQVTAAPTGGNYLFWATKNADFITAPGVTNESTKLTTSTGLSATSANYGTPGGATDNVKITWSDDILSKTKYKGTVGDPAQSPTFVAVYYNGTVCADNLKVYELDPIKAFTVDIRNIKFSDKSILAFDATTDQCIADVSSAKYVAGAMVYEYGVNTFYYEVIAANFTASWTPTFNFTVANAVQTYVIEWTYDDPTLWTAATVWNAATDVVTTAATNTSAGVSIYARVTVTNNNFEGTAASTVTLAVDGQNSVGDWDIVNDATATCIPAAAADQNDVAIQTINPRPAITTTTPSVIAPNTVLIPGNEVN